MKLNASIHKLEEKQKANHPVSNIIIIIIIISSSSSSSSTSSSGIIAITITFS